MHRKLSSSSSDIPLSLRVTIFYDNEKALLFLPDVYYKASDQQIRILKEDISALKLPLPPVDGIQCLRDGQVAFQWQSSLNSTLYKTLIKVLRPSPRSPRAEELKATMERLSMVRLLLSSKKGNSRPWTLAYHPYQGPSPDHGETANYTRSSFQRRLSESSPASWGPALEQYAYTPPPPPYIPPSPTWGYPESYFNQQQVSTTPLSARITGAPVASTSGSSSVQSYENPTPGSAQYRQPPTPSTSTFTFTQDNNNSGDWRNSRTTNVNARQSSYDGSAGSISTPMSRGIKRPYSPSSASASASSNSTSRRLPDLPPPATRPRLSLDISEPVPASATNTYSNTQLEQRSAAEVHATPPPHSSGVTVTTNGTRRLSQFARRPAVSDSQAQLSGSGTVGQTPAPRSSASATGNGQSSGTRQADTSTSSSTSSNSTPPTRRATFQLPRPFRPTRPKTNIEEVEVDSGLHAGVNAPNTQAPPHLGGGGGGGGVEESATATALVVPIPEPSSTNASTGIHEQAHARTPPPPKPQPPSPSTSSISASAVSVGPGWPTATGSVPKAVPKVAVGVGVGEGSAKQKEKEKERVEVLKKELENLRVGLKEAKERETNILTELRLMGAAAEAEAGASDDDELVPKHLLLHAEHQLQDERRRREEAEFVVEDVRRECKAPFLVPALVDVIETLSGLTTRTLRVGWEQLEQQEQAQREREWEQREQEQREQREREVRREKEEDFEEVVVDLGVPGGSSIAEGGGG